jgi:hypothetical protein
MYRAREIRMHLFELLATEGAISQNGGPLVPDGRLMYAVPDEAEEILAPILGKYDQDPFWFFDRLNFGRPPAPWAIVCLDREYALAGHIATSRPPDAGIAFAGYKEIPKPLPLDFAPGVGVLVFYSKNGLELAANNSPIFTASWKALQAASARGTWIAVLDPLPEEWLSQVLPGDCDAWLASPSAERFRQNVE